MFRLIELADWPSVDRIQCEAYDELLQESLAVLQQKAELSPKTCFVYQADSGEVQGYCLAHYCTPGVIPELDTLAEAEAQTRQHLFLHDMALAKMAQGQGVATRFFEFLVQQARQLGVVTVALVAVQGSVGFWQKRGFQITENSKVASYGSDARYMVLGLTQ